MEISFLGAGGVKISGRHISILCDPPPEAVKNKPAADVFILSSLEIEKPIAEGMLIDGPGEYEVKEALITGIPAQLHIDAEGKRGTIFTINLDGVNVAFLGNMAPGLANDQIEQMGQIDVLVLPVGGHGLTLDATAAAQIVSQAEPKYVIPTHYDDGKSKYAMPQDKVDKFTSEIGSNPEPVSKLKVNSKEMPLETTIVVLQA